GEVTGHAEEAADLVDEMRAEIDEILQEVPEREVRPTYYHELDDTLYTVTSQTFIGELYALAGLENVADAADPNGEFGGAPPTPPTRTASSAGTPSCRGSSSSRRTPTSSSWPTPSAAARTPRPSPPGPASPTWQPCGRAGWSSWTRTSRPAGGRGWSTSCGRS